MTAPATIPPPLPEAHATIPATSATVDVLRRAKAARLFDQKDARIAEMQSEIAQVSARLGTARELPGDQEAARTLVHDFSNYMHQLLLVNEIEKIPGSL